MPEQQLQSSYSEEFLEGYTKAKNEDKEELSRTLENNEYAELGKSVITLLKYFRGNINE